jgi:hypothetical protein
MSKPMTRAALAALALSLWLVLLLAGWSLRGAVHLLLLMALLLFPWRQPGALERRGGPQEEETP